MIVKGNGVGGGSASNAEFIHFPMEGRVGCRYTHTHKWLRNRNVSFKLCNKIAFLQKSVVIFFSLHNEF